MSGVAKVQLSLIMFSASASADQASRALSPGWAVQLSDGKSLKPEKKHEISHLSSSSSQG